MPIVRPKPLSLETRLAAALVAVLRRDLRIGPLDPDPPPPELLRLAREYATAPDNSDRSSQNVSMADMESAMTAWPSYTPRTEDDIPF